MTIRCGLTRGEGEAGRPRGQDGEVTSWVLRMLCETRCMQFSRSKQRRFDVKGLRVEVFRASVAPRR